MELQKENCDMNPELNWIACLMKHKKQKNQHSLEDFNRAQSL